MMLANKPTGYTTGMRRPQFSLKRLLVALTLFCLLLGLWDFLSVVFTPSVAAKPVITGQAIQIHGRFFDSSGREWETCFVDVRKPANSGGSDIYRTRGTQVKRQWPGFYYLDLELPPVDEPGEYTITATRLAMYAGEKKTIRGSVIVSAKRQD
jgi:hypothetical protein